MGETSEERCRHCIHLARGDELARPITPLTVSPFSGATDSISIMRLPYEILSDIFTRTIAADGCHMIHRMRLHPLLTFRTTCKYWYHTVASNRLLWSHIDISFSNCHGNMYRFHIGNSTRLWLQHSKAGPIHLHFVVGYGNSHILTSELLQIFQPYSNHISAVTFSHQWPEELVRDVLELCCSHAVPGTLKHLAVAEAFELEDVKTDYERWKWPVGFLRGLSSLHIGRLDDAIGFSMSQLWTILVNSPHLRILQLKGQHIVSSDCIENYNLPAVPLYSLRVLELENIQESELLQLLQTVLTGKSRLHFGLSVETCDPTVLAAVKTFMKRSRIVSLGLGEDAIAIAKDFSDAPELHTLHFDLNSGYWENINLLVNSATAIPRCPTIQRLHFTNGYIPGEPDRELIRCVVNAYNPQEIYFVGFKIPTRGYYTNWGKSNRGEEEELISWLVQRVDIISLSYSSPSWDLLAEKQVL
ncbi:hypothetical protein FRC12_025184 [Ceratobasidium sp. 428]|nr:hypothetical protein FRC12_025184 [Ceratobasidium sp. 428]